MGQKKKIATGLLSCVIGVVSFFCAESKDFDIDVFAKEVQSENRKSQKQTGPLITYESQQIGDREKLKVTVRVEGRNGVGIKEFRDHKGKLINGNSYTFEITRRSDYTFTAIDNNNVESSVKIDDFWVNPYTSDKQDVSIYRSTTGSTYWGSSNLREWLNSKDSIVNYTSNPPTNENTNGNGYDKEAGFLSEFTEEEYNAIAVVDRIVWCGIYFDPKANVSKYGGNPGHFTETMPITLSNNLNQVLKYKEYSYSIERDKVYVPNAFEMYWYLEKRGFELKKQPTENVQRKYNISNNYYSWFLSGTTSGGLDINNYYNEMGYVVNDKGRYHYSYTDRNGLVPMLSIKPNFILKSGKVSSDLGIGELVEFVTYKGESILWRVVNMSDNNSPLLISEHVIDIKKFDAKGDNSRLYSDYIAYDYADINFVDSLQYKPINLNYSYDAEIPKGVVVNEDDLKVRQNLSFDLEFRFTDDESGVDYIKMPDGNITYGSSFTYTFNKNGNYIFEVVDKAGNFNKFGIPIGNINDEVSLKIESEAENKWSNNGNVYIESSNSVRRFIKRDVTGNYQSPPLPNYISYSGVTFKVKGRVEVVSVNKEILNDLSKNVNIGFVYDTQNGNNQYTYTSGRVFNYAMSRVEIECEKGYSVNIDSEIRIPTNYLRELKPSVEVGRGMVVRFDIEYYLQDDSDFAIQSIELPDGTVISDIKEYTDVIVDEGIHNLRYKVLDSRGVTTEKTITVKIDKTAPELNLTYSKDELVNNKSATINITASDSLSGVKRIRLPNGNYINSDKATYDINGSGDYVFECEDIAGNITNKTISINGNNSNLNTEVNKNDNWTNRGVQINIDLRK